MYDAETWREDARAESAPVTCPVCEYQEPGRTTSDWTCGACGEFTQCPECGWCRDCQEEIGRPNAPMSPLGALLFDIAHAMSLADGRRARGEAR